MERTLGWTYPDLWSLPAESQDRHRYEILEGCLVKEPPPSTRHETLVTRLVGHLWTALTPRERDGLFVAQTGVVFDRDTIVQPDVVYVGPRRLPGILREDALHGAPDLLIEVLSPSSRDRDLAAKRSLYARHRVSEYWIVDPGRRSLMIFRDPERGRYRRARELTSGAATSTVVPRFQPDLGALFDTNL